MKPSDVDQFVGKQVLVDTEDGDQALGLLRRLKDVVLVDGRDDDILAEYEVVNKSSRTLLSAAELIGLRWVDI